jgi:polyvinyl alcohol dehydrogenase (cytochrome)
LLLFIAARPVSAQDGSASSKQNCASCHDAGVDRAPGREALQAMTAERVLAALENGAMISMASRSSAAERRAIAQFVTGKSLSKKDVDMTPAPQSMCATAGDFTNPLTGPLWNGWGENTSNTRYQDDSAAGFTAPDVPRLKVKWAFGFPYSLSAGTGCIHWFVQAAGAVRAAVTVGRVGTGAYSTISGAILGTSTAQARTRP